MPHGTPHTFVNLSLGAYSDRELIYIHIHIVILTFLINAHFTPLYVMMM